MVNVPDICGRMRRTVHAMDQAEGGEQGDVWMPVPFSLGQHAALEAVQRHPSGQ